MPPTETPLQTVVKAVTDKDITTEFDDFDTRLAFQKAIYLLQSAGSIEERYPFNYYARGPYSPGWAKEGFALAEGEPHNVEVIRSMDPVVDAAKKHFGDAEWLEALATLHWYVTQDGKDHASSLARAIDLGKKCLVDRFEEAWTTLNQLFPASFV